MFPDVCLTITVRPTGLSRDNQRRLIKLYPLLHAGRGNVLSVHGCEFLTNDADWTVRTWDLNVEGRKVLGELLSGVLNELSGEPIVAALWDGDRSAVEQPVTAPQLLALVDSNQIETRATYRVLQRTTEP
jgi:hypothetical protein